MGDKRTDPGHYYPGGRVRAKSGTAPQELIVQWSDVQGKPQIAPLPDRYRDSDVKGKINEIASKFATVVVAALIGWTACADITVQKKRKDQIHNDEQVVVDVSGYGVEMNTNTVRDIAREEIEQATNAVNVAMTNRYTKAETDSKIADTISANEKTGTDRQVVRGRIESEYWQIKVANAQDASWAVNVDWYGVMNHPDTLFGYGITNGATKTELAAKLGLYDTAVRAESSECLSLIDTGDTIQLVYTGGRWASRDSVNPDKPFAYTSEIPVISATDPTFSNAVLAVQIDTNTVAQIGELNGYIHDYGELGATSVGGLIIALLGAAAYLKKKTALLETDGKASDTFATDLMGKPVAISAIDARIKTNAESAAEPTDAVTLNDNAPKTVTVATVESPATPSLAVTFGTARNGGLRICELYVLNGTADTDLTFDSAVHFVSTGDSFPACESGINYFVFAEVAANLWKVTRETLKSITTPTPVAAA